MFLIKKMKFFKRMDDGILLLERQDWLRHNFMESLHGTRSQVIHIQRSNSIIAHV